MYQIGLVTVLFNSNDVLEGFFKSLSKQSFKNYQLYLIDNTPGVDSDELINNLKSRYPVGDFVHVKNSENAGVAKGNNQGISLSLAAGTSHTLILNNDIEFEQENLLEQLYLTAINKNESILIPKILYFQSREIWMAGGRLLKPWAITKHVGERAVNNGQFDDEKYFEYAPTCFMLIKNEVFEKIGVMDEKYFVYYDDTDFIYRAVLKGYKVFYSPQHTVLHKVSSLTGGAESPFVIYYGNRNRIYFIKKNYKGSMKYISLFLTLSSRIYKYLIYDKVQREQLIKGLKEGFRLATTI